jgi:hypothetical protein
MSRPRQYKLAAAFKRDPHAYEALQPKPRRQPLDLDESKPWPLPGQSQPNADQQIQEPKQ